MLDTRALDNSVIGNLLNILPAPENVRFGLLKEITDDICLKVGAEIEFSEETDISHLFQTRFKQVFPGENLRALTDEWEFIVFKNAFVDWRIQQCHVKPSQRFRSIADKALNLHKNALPYAMLSAELDREEGTIFAFGEAKNISLTSSPEQIEETLEERVFIIIPWIGKQVIVLTSHKNTVHGRKDGVGAVKVYFMNPMSKPSGSE